MNDVAEARRALGQERPDEALVFLWNALEPARLANDRRALATIAGMANRIAAEGDVVQQREAGRLLEAIGEAREAAGVSAGGAAEVGTVGYAGEAAPVGVREGAPEAAYEPAPEEFELEEGEEEAAGQRSRLRGLIPLLIFIAVIVINVLQGFRGDE